MPNEAQELGKQAQLGPGPRKHLLGSPRISVPSYLDLTVCPSHGSMMLYGPSESFR